MSADPDDSFTLDMITPAAPSVEMSEAGKSKAARKPANAFKARLLGFVVPGKKPRARRREPVLIPPRVPNEPRHFAKRDSAKLDSATLDLANIDLPEKDLPKKDLPKLGLPKLDLPKLDLAETDPAEISAEASSESPRAPTYEELWREPRRLAASISLAPAPRDRLPGWAAAVAILLGASALIALREKIVDVAPPAAKAFAAIGLPVNLAGLELREVRSHIEMDGARKVLAVEGEIANMRRESRSVPPVALTVRGEDGQAKYAWTTRAAKSRLEPGETIAFRARLASPPESGADVLVRFSSLEEAGRPGSVR